MIKFDVMNRFSGALQFTAEIDAKDDTSLSVKIGLAVKWAITSGANLHGADLRSADLRSANLCGANLHGADLRSADLRSANLCGANLRSANLRSANLHGADLCGANLRSANLRSANLHGADLRSADLHGANLRSANLGKDQWVITGPVRSDGYQFFLMRLKDEKEPMVHAGCRWFTLIKAKAHWETTRKDTQLGNESLDILIWLEKAMTARGLK